jgi:hypothetical protein
MCSCICKKKRKRESTNDAPYTDLVERKLTERELLIDNLLVRIHSIVETISVDWPCATGV